MFPLLLAALIQQPAQAGPRTPYWQQHVAYDITARLDEPTGVLGGREQIHYTNHSPDTLTSFALHLHLNAFRPGSRWSDADSVEGRRRFNDLKDPDYGFNHVRNVRIMGQPVEAVYPFAPDSTIVRFMLPEPLAPGGSMDISMDWDARPSTVPRRQGRRGRHFDFAQWYPKVVVYDRYGWEEHPLYPAGEFYGEFGSFIVRLDVPEDQVVGATGVPVCGDPGWERANQLKDSPVEYQRDFYGSKTAALGNQCAPASNGRKRLIWYADDVHHFAMSMAPDYRYEGGRYKDVAVHVLYQPGDEKSWGNGVAVKRTEIALDWLDSLYGKFDWPQITNVHRIEGGGTEFPMMIHNGSAGQGLIVHELGHNYTMGILANNEWREGFLDEGFTSFQSAWFAEEQSGQSQWPGTDQFILNLDLDGMSEPASLVSDKYRDFTSYNIAIYTRGQMFYEFLRYIVGDDTMREILRTFYQRWQLKHVDEAAFRDVAEEVSGLNLSTFFGQWLHGTPLYDYGIGRVKRDRQADGSWLTRVEVVRHEKGRLPVEVAVIAGSDTVVKRVDGLAAKEWVEATTAAKPSTIRLDPRVRTHDWNMLNNERHYGVTLKSLIAGPGPVKLGVDKFFSQPVYRDQLAMSFAPTIWYNSVGGITLGLRERSNYLGRFVQNETQYSMGTGWANEDNLDQTDPDVAIRVRNPTWLRAPGLTLGAEGMHVEGRGAAKIGADWNLNRSLQSRTIHTVGLQAQWVGVTDPEYLEPGTYSDGGSGELEAHAGVTSQAGEWALALHVSAAGGGAYQHPGIGAPAGTGSQLGAYFRGSLEATASRPLSRRLTLDSRLFAGTFATKGPEIRQRQFFLSGAGPYAQLWNPFTRSRGSLFRQEDIHYHVPGDANVRGLDHNLAAPDIIALNLELAAQLYGRRGGGLFRNVSLALFGDGALADGDLADPITGHMRLTGDAGVGLRASHRIGQTDFQTRVDFPLWVDREELADDRDTLDPVAFRWTFSFEPAW
ncbi:MAG TPA: M1 family metallopeptidase [Gemmatimonadales bacterium]|nr:M1 family metallopeptidase [Gemmatimonadales bacterium]